MSWGFFTDDIPPVRRTGPGMGPAIVGTIVITGDGHADGVPLGILGAVYLHEYGKTGRLAAVLRFIADVMTGVPSIIMGLFIYTIWVVRFGVNGVNGFGGALALGCLMLPIVIRSTEEMLRLVPDDLREASYALGSSKARTILTVVLPAALPRHRERRAARRRPRRRRDGAAAVHDRRGDARSTGTCSRARTPRCRCRSSPTPSSRSPAPRSGRGAPR